MGNCTAKTKRGTACKMAPLAGNEHCFTHAPGAARERAREVSRRAGGAERGRALSSPPPSGLPNAADDNTSLLFLSDVEDAQRKVAIDLLEGRLSSRDALARTRVLDALARRIIQADADDSK
jgi:hypothetical protein